LIISIASGKGGTGKTTIAVNLACSIEENVQLLDCDVEEPNCHLFLNLKMDGKETVFAPVPDIDESKCTYCKKCAEICRFKAIAILKNIAMVFPELCHSCGGCMAVCPENAITETGRELGIIELGQQNKLAFVHGRLRVGEAMSPPLIRKVRSLIQPEKINIIDAPPGTSCPVITAMKGVDFVLMVTEPTPFGLYDLKLAVEAVKLLKIPCGIVINRADIGDHQVKTYATQENIPVLMEIPFDRRIAEIYSKGGLLIQDMPEWKDKFCELYKKIENAIKVNGSYFH
jgi:MinD superfamily P-loop ATPase